MRMNDHAKRLFNYLFSPKGYFPFSSNIQISRIFLGICVNKYIHLGLFCFWLILSFWQERRRIERRQMDQRRKKQGPRLQRTRLFESMCLFISVHWFKMRCLLREMIFLLAPSGALIAITTYYWPTPPPTFSDHTGLQHWTFTFWATTAI